MTDDELAFHSVDLLAAKDRRKVKSLIILYQQEEKNWMIGFNWPFDISEPVILLSSLQSCEATVQDGKLSFTFFRVQVNKNRDSI